MFHTNSCVIKSNVRLVCITRHVGLAKYMVAQFGLCPRVGGTTSELYK